jgi:single-stranded DNA-specific DHH superfamily exonuclease
MTAIGQETDFLRDRAIIVMGEEWNSGVIGLAAGRASARSTIFRRLC